MYIFHTIYIPKHIPYTLPNIFLLLKIKLYWNKKRVAFATLSAVTNKVLCIASLYLIRLSFLFGILGVAPLALS